MKTLIVAEHDNKILKQATFHTVSAVKELNTSADILVIGYQCHQVAEQASSLLYIDKVLLADHTVYEHQLAENTAAFIAKLGEKYDYIISASTTFGKNIMPRVAALLDQAMLSDVIKIVSPDTFVRPMYAGNVLATIQSKDKIKIMTVRTTAFPAIKKLDNKATIETITDEIQNNLSQFEKQTLTQSERPELTSARIVISGGRGLKNAENFKLIEEIADDLGAAVGASRAAVDAGFAPNDYQVGQTGKVVAPDLYIAVGISGAIQHLAGMKDSKIVVAINNDPDAPIFQASDYVLVGDLFKILPEFKAALEKS